MHKKLVIHSDHVAGKIEVDQKFFEMCGKDPKEVKIAYIPSQSDSDGTRKYYHQKVSWYSQFGVKPEHMLYFDIDREYDPSQEDALFVSDAIFLSGGNTFYFLKNLKKGGFIEKLRAFVERGGILIGLSAGGIMMSRTIDIVDSLGLDTNDVQLEDYSALSINDFDFLPHFDGRNEMLKKLQVYSQGRVVYAVQDGGGLIICGDTIEPIGEVVTLINGKQQ